MAAFYNSMNNQIIASQKSMLVEQAIHFESTAMSFKMNKMISWENQGELMKYTEEVEKALNHVVHETKRLRKLHLDLVALVNSMFEIDLLTQRSIWNQKMEEVRKIVNLGVSQKDPKLCLPWRRHWDHQLFKVLEYQFKRMLIHPNLIT